MPSTQLALTLFLETARGVNDVHLGFTHVTFKFNF